MRTDYIFVMQCLFPEICMYEYLLELSIDRNEWLAALIFVPRLFFLERVCFLAETNMACSRSTPIPTTKAERE